MKFLLDTNILLWALAEPSKISDDIKNILINPNYLIYASTVNVWEVIIKSSIGKLKIPNNIEEQIIEHRFVPLPITFKHAICVGTLPNIHNDPFDRLLIAQAIEEKLTIITSDTIIPKYPNVKVA